jgi:Xaa-Pro aminopeptidase
MLNTSQTGGAPVYKVALIYILLMLAGCSMPGGRSWIIPLTIDPSDLSITPEQRERYLERRNRVASGLDGAVVLLRSDQPDGLNRHQYRPNNYFYYLTGCDIPRTFMVLSAGRGETGFAMAAPPENIRMMIYEGAPMREEKMDALFGPDKIYSYSEFRSVMDSLLKSDLVIYTDLSDREFVNDLKRRAGEGSENRFLSVAQLVDEQRVIKGAMEVARLQKACNITSQALVNVMRNCEPEMYEFEMEAVIEGTFLEYGASMPGFSSIVGSGPNSTTLHYEPNDRMMEKGDLLLMDIGAEYGYYTADITRTIPVNGRFTREQEAIYQLVLDAQKLAIDVMKPGIPLGEAHLVAGKRIIRGLYELGLVTDTTSAWQQSFYILYPASHYLGLDVHDVGDYGSFFMGFYRDPLGSSSESRNLEPGMVLTIEPGIYIREAGLDQLQDIYGSRADSAEIAQFIEQVSPVYSNYVNIGVRIEDDILITRDGNINLSRYAPKEVDDIEQLMR